MNSFLSSKPVQVAIWIVVSLLGATGWGLLATARGETINTIWFLVAGVCTYAIGYRFYSKFIVKSLMKPDDSRKTPAVEFNDGANYSPTSRVTLFGHHFASIAGAGPLVGPVLAAQMGYLPSTMWIVFGVVFAGAVQDMLVLFFSIRSKGESLGQMAQNLLGSFGGKLVTVIVFIMTLIVLAVLALLCVNAMADSVWAVFSISCTIPIALFMGAYLKWIRPGKVTEVSIIGFVLLIFAVFGGEVVAETEWGQVFHLTQMQLVVYIAIYCLLVAILPVWLFLVPKDYLATFMKVGTIVILAVAIVVVRPLAQVPDFTNFAFNTAGPAFAGSLFPFLFITIACGALSGFHATIASGTTPKMVAKESHIRSIGYGGMLMESFVALMALTAAVSLNQGVYFSMNMPEATIITTAGQDYNASNSKEDNAAAAVEKLDVNADHQQITPIWFTTDDNGVDSEVKGAAALEQVAQDVGEKSIVSRTGGAPTLAVAMSNILHSVPVIGGRNMIGFWYHFAVMFEALFILSAVSAGTMSMRNQLRELLGNIKPLEKFKDSSWMPGNVICALIIIALWTALLVMGVTDPNGGIKIMYPLFGVANQLIAVVALLLLTLIVIKEKYYKLLWITAIPLVFVTVVTFTASFMKIFSDDPAIGYFKMGSVAQEKLAQIDGSGANVVALESTVRNSIIQGSLSVLFVVLVGVLLVFAAVQLIRNPKNRSFEAKPLGPASSAGRIEIGQCRV
ncbi:carbon starvation protein [Actinomycetota bacterium]|nr:carbon starvation protein [Actinomycetota bacterium]